MRLHRRELRLQADGVRVAQPSRHGAGRKRAGAVRAVARRARSPGRSSRACRGRSSVARLGVRLGAGSCGGDDRVEASASAPQCVERAANAAMRHRARSRPTGRPRRSPRSTGWTRAAERRTASCSPASLTSRSVLDRPSVATGAAGAASARRRAGRPSVGALEAHALAAGASSPRRSAGGLHDVALGLPHVHVGRAAARPARCSGSRSGTSAPSGADQHDAV